MSTGTTRPARTMLIIESGSGLPHHDDRLTRWSDRVAWALQPRFDYGTWRKVRPGDKERVENCDDGSCSIVGQGADARYWSALNEVTGRVETWKTWYAEHITPMLDRMAKMKAAGRPVVFHGGGWLINDHLPVDDQRARCQQVAADIKARFRHQPLPLDAALLDYEMDKPAGAVFALFSPIARLAPMACNFNFSGAQRPGDRDLDRMYWDNGRGKAKGNVHWTAAPGAYEAAWEPDRYRRMYRYLRDEGKGVVPWLPVVHTGLDYTRKVTDPDEVWALNEAHVRLAWSFGARVFVLASYMVGEPGTVGEAAKVPHQPTVEKLIDRLDWLLGKLEGNT